MNDAATHRTTTPVTMPVIMAPPTTIAAGTASRAVGWSCAYGARENPATVSQPIPARTGATTGSATADPMPTISAARMSTQPARYRAVGGGRGCPDDQQRGKAGRQRERSREPAPPPYPRLC